MFEPSEPARFTQVFGQDVDPPDPCRVFVASFLIAAIGEDRPVLGE